MKSLCLDTHTWVWAYYETRKLPDSLKIKMENVDQLFVSAVSVYEIGQKVRLGKWPDMSAEKLDLMITDKVSDITLLPISAEIAKTASLMDWPHRDPFDRLIAATAIDMQCGLASRDDVFEGLFGIERVWS